MAVAEGGVKALFTDTIPLVDLAQKSEKVETAHGKSSSHGNMSS
jgi:hypothetical protein